MKKILVLLLLLASGKSFAQNAYYDALKLRRAIRWNYSSSADGANIPPVSEEKTAPYSDGSIKPDSTTPGGVQMHFTTTVLTKKAFAIKDTAAYDTVKAIFKNYSLKKDSSKFSDIAKDYQKNKFIAPNIPDGYFASGISAPGISLASIGSTDVTTIADGIGKFLADRTKEELDIAFFQEFNNFLTAHPEIRQLFPATTSLLDNIYNYQSTSMLSILRAAFQSDLKGLLGNIAAIADLDENTQCNCKNTKQTNNCKERLRTIKAFFNTEYGRTVMTALIVADGAINHKNPADILAAMAGNKTLQNMATGSAADKDIINSLTLLNIFSQSLRSNVPGQIWVSQADLKTLVDDSVALRMYTGLLYQQIANANIVIGGDTVATILAKLQPDGLTALKNYITGLDTELKNLAQDYTTLKKSSLQDTSSDALSANAIAFITDLQNVMATGMQYNQISASLPAPGPKFQLVFNCIDTTLNIAQMIAAKNYYGAILSTSMLIEQILQTHKDFYPKGQVLDTASITFLDSLRKKVPATNTNIIRLRSQVNKAQKKVKSDNISYTYSSGMLHITVTKDSATKISDSIRVPTDLGKLLEPVKTKPDSIKILVSFYIRTSDDISINKKNFITNLLQYGNFMADIVSAQNSDDAEKAIAAIALPPGSSSIKKNTNFNICIQAYTGIAMTKEPEGTSVFNGMSVSAPIGVAFSFGLKNWRNPYDKRTKGSATIFLSLVDVGAIVAYRFKEPSAQLADTVKIRLENIFAPGANIVYGIPKLPLSVGGGLQWQPSLERLSTSSATIAESSGWRWHLFLALDLPLLNISNSRR